MISFGGYKVCILDLVCDHKTGKLSSNKIWYHAANLIESYRIFFNSNVEWMEILIYLAIVGGSNIAMQAIKWRFRDGSYSTQSDPCLDQK